MDMRCMLELQLSIHQRPFQSLDSRYRYRFHSGV